MATEDLADKDNGRHIETADYEADDQGRNTDGEAQDATISTAARATWKVVVAGVAGFGTYLHYWAVLDAETAVSLGAWAGESAILAVLMVGSGAVYRRVVGWETPMTSLRWGVVATLAAIPTVLGVAITGYTSLVFLIPLSVVAFVVVRGVGVAWDRL